jgi:hypothetical protein
MGSKKTLPIYYPYQPATDLTQGITPLVVTGTNTYQSSPSTYVGNIDNIGCQVTFSGTPTGTLSVLGSNDNVSFFALTFSPSLTQPSGAALSYGIDLNQFPWSYLAFSYVNSASTGGLIVSVFGKDLN